MNNPMIFDFVSKCVPSSFLYYSKNLLNFNVIFYHTWIFNQKYNFKRFLLKYFSFIVKINLVNIYLFFVKENCLLKTPSNEREDGTPVTSIVTSWWSKSKNAWWIL